MAKSIKKETGYNRLPKWAGKFLNFLNRHNINPFESQLFEDILFGLVLGVLLAVVLLLIGVALKTWLLAFTILFFAWLMTTLDVRLIR